MCARKMVRLAIVLQEELLEMSQRVLLSEQSPDTLFVVCVAVVELLGFQLCKFADEGFVDYEVLITVGTWRFILLRSDSRLQEFCHFEIRVAKQCRDTDDWSYHLCIEGAAAIADKNVGLFAVA